MKMSRMHLSRDREQTMRMHHRAVHQVDAALALCLAPARTKEQWACVRRDKHLTMFAKKPATSAAPAVLLGVSEAKCGFDEVLELLSFDSTSKFRLLLALVLGRDCKDAGLISMRPRTDQLSDWSLNTQHAAVWFALQNRRKAALVREKSFTFFQMLKVLLPETRPSGIAAATGGGGGGAGRRSEAVMKRTMALAWLPFPDADTFSFEDDARDAVSLQYTLLIEELASDRLRVSCVTSAFHDPNAPQAASRWSTRAVARRLVFCSIARLESAVVASRISDQEFVSQHQWVKNEDRAACVICWKYFNALFRRRHHCRLCGEVVCGSCSSLRRTNVVKRKDLEKVRVCHLCSNKGRAKADSFASTTDTFPGPHMTDEEMPTAKLFPGAGVVQKVISIRTMLRSDLTVRSMTTAQRSDAKRAVVRKANSGGPGDIDTGGSREQLVPRPHDLARFSLSFLHPAARAPPNARALQPVVADVGSYEEHALAARDSEASSVRRTSIASSNCGLLDRYYVDEGYFLPKLDPARETQRLRLMSLVCSPACTLIDPLLMKKCCEVAASAFGVPAAFIARVEEHHVSIEHSLGLPRLLSYDQYVRHDTPCDFVLVQPAHHPLVILDCLVDPRTAGIPMVQQMGMRFFVGACISVRGLPIGCLCAFGQESASEGQLAPTRFDLSILENAVRSIEAELEALVQGLYIS
ncbi:hypothetical protein PybrP1_004531 [[Pythium] brassicae (nom. inval.)]|nr:hypothetical protein PybrP1_004531 [[Pythium] brassicae (nom. inval.)]